jgi:hypothetical protein
MESLLSYVGALQIIRNGGDVQLVDFGNEIVACDSAIEIAGSGKMMSS